MMCAVRSASSSASLPWASLSHLTSLPSRSFRVFPSAMSSGPFVGGRLGRAAAARQLQLTVDRGEHGLAASVARFVEPHGGQLCGAGLLGTLDHCSRVHVRVPVPRFDDRYGGAGAVLGSGLGHLADELGLFGDVNGL